MVDLSGLFQLYCPLSTNKVLVYEPEGNRFVGLGQLGAEKTGLLPCRLVETPIVMIRFRKRE